MPNTHPHIPRTLIIFLAAIIMVALLVGIFRAFAPARAAAVAAPNSLALVTVTPTVVTATDTISQTPPMKTVDMTGIIALGIILVAIIIFGSIWGRRMALTGASRK
jgi:hypothetical protein